MRSNKMIERYGSYLRVLIYTVIVTLMSTACVGAADVASQLPNTCVAFARVNNLQKWQSDVSISSLREVLANPAFEPFVRDVQSRIEADQFSKDVGFTFEELKRLGTKEVAAALMPSPNMPKSAFVLLIDTTESQTLVTQALADQAKRFSQWGYKSRNGEFANAAMSFVEYKAESNSLVVFHRDGVLAVSDDMDAARIVAESIHNGSKLLLDKPEFKYIRRHSEETGNLALGQLDWYLEPWRYIKSQEKQSKDTQLALRQGFDAVDSVGGRVCLGSNGLLASHRTVVHVRRPLKNAARALAFERITLATPLWLRSGLGSLNAIGLDIRTAFQGYSHWFDAKQGDEGLFDLVIDEIRDDPEGPQVDVRKKLIQQLTGPLYTIQMPLKSDRTLPACVYAMEAKDIGAVQAAIAGLLKDDPDAQLTQVANAAGWKFGDLTRGGTEQVLGPDLSGLTFCFFEDYLIASKESSAIADLISNDVTPFANSAQQKRLATAIRNGGEAMIGYRYSANGDWLLPQYEFLRKGKWGLEDSSSMSGITRLVSMSVRNRVPMLREAFKKLPESSAVQAVVGEAYGRIGEIDDEGWVVSGTIQTRE